MVPIRPWLTIQHDNGVSCSNGWHWETVVKWLCILPLWTWSKSITSYTMYHHASPRGDTASCLACSIAIYLAPMGVASTSIWHFPLLVCQHTTGSKCAHSLPTVFPLTFSVARELAAMADPQPKVLNLASTMTPLSSTSICHYRDKSSRKPARHEPVYVHELILEAQCTFTVRCWCTAEGRLYGGYTCLFFLLLRFEYRVKMKTEQGKAANTKILAFLLSTILMSTCSAEDSWPPKNLTILYNIRACSLAKSIFARLTEPNTLFPGNRIFYSFYM